MIPFLPNLAWFDRLLPGGLPLSSSALLSDPDGSGKPLIDIVIMFGELQ